MEGKKRPRNLFKKQKRSLSKTDSFLKLEDYYGAIPPLKLDSFEEISRIAHEDHIGEIINDN